MQKKKHNKGNSMQALMNYANLNKSKKIMRAFKNAAFKEK